MLQPDLLRCRGVSVHTLKFPKSLRYLLVYSLPTRLSAINQILNYPAAKDRWDSGCSPRNFPASPTALNLWRQSRQSPEVPSPRALIPLVPRVLTSWFSMYTLTQIIKKLLMTANSSAPLKMARFACRFRYKIFNKVMTSMHYTP